MVETPDEDFNHTVNVWGLYNCLITFAWSRSASLVYNGERDGLGFRDSVQDLLGVTAAIPKEAAAAPGTDADRPGLQRRGHADRSSPSTTTPARKSRLRPRNTARMTACGSSTPSRPTSTRPATWISTTRCCPTPTRARPPSWPPAARAGIQPGTDGQARPALRPGRRLERLPEAGLLRRKPVRGLPGAPGPDASMPRSPHGWANPEKPTGRSPSAKNWIAASRRCAWDGDWFIWAIGEDGTVYGTKEYAEGQVYLNTQLWSVISGTRHARRSPALHADRQRAGWPRPTG